MTSRPQATTDVIVLNTPGSATRDAVMRLLMPVNIAEFDRCTASIQSILSARLQTAFARSRPRRQRRYPHSAQPSRGFVQSGFYEVALTSALQVPPCHATSQNPPDSRIHSLRFDSCVFLFYTFS